MKTFKEDMTDLIKRQALTELTKMVLTANKTTKWTEEALKLINIAKSNEIIDDLEIIFTKD